MSLSSIAASASCSFLRKSNPVTISLLSGCYHWDFIHHDTDVWEVYKPVSDTITRPEVGMTWIFHDWSGDSTQSIRTRMRPSISYLFRILFNGYMYYIVFQWGICVLGELGADNYVSFFKFMKIEFFFVALYLAYVRHKWYLDMRLQSIQWITVNP